MDTVTIPKKLAAQGDLVLVPRKEYEALRAILKMKDFIPTAAQRKALARAERNLKTRKTLSLNDLRRKLGFRN